MSQPTTYLRALSVLALFIGLLTNGSALAGKGGGAKPPTDTPPVWYSVTLIENPFGGLNTIVKDMNNSLELVGDADVEPANTNDGDYRAFVYTKATGMIDLNSLIPEEDRDGWVMVFCGRNQ
jgi:probable HAF family extracellular repeat protein